MAQLWCVAARTWENPHTCSLNKKFSCNSDKMPRYNSDWLKVWLNRCFTSLLTTLVSSYSPELKLKEDSLLPAASRLLQVTNTLQHFTLELVLFGFLASLAHSKPTSTSWTLTGRTALHTCVSPDTPLWSSGDTPLSLISVDLATKGHATLRTSSC